MRASQRRLGDSVGWIVDTLLLDEESPENEEQLKIIRSRKREALECLAYVRDVLKGSVTEVEDERLVGEEERKRRQSLQEEEAAEAAKAHNKPAMPSPPQPAASPPAGSRPVAMPSRPTRTAEPPSLRPLPKAAADFLRQGTVEGARPPLSSSSPSDNASKTAPIAPWSYTRSDFSIRDSPITSLPRVPPRTSTMLPTNKPAFSPPRVAEQPVSRADQAPRRVIEQDPLGVLR